MVWSPSAFGRRAQHGRPRSLAPPCAREAASLAARAAPPRSSSQPPQMAHRGWPGESSGRSAPRPSALEFELDDAVASSRRTCSWEMPVNVAIRRSASLPAGQPPAPPSTPRWSPHPPPPAARSPAEAGPPRPARPARRRTARHTPVATDVTATPGSCSVPTRTRRWSGSSDYGNGGCAPCERASMPSLRSPKGSAGGSGQAGSTRTGHSPTWGEL